MLFNEEVIFIHIGKTGGISCSQYLLKNLKPTVYNCHENAVESTRRLGIEGIVAMENTRRHWTLEQTVDFIQAFNGRRITDFKKVFAVVRHPFTLEYSFYGHMLKTEVQQRRGEASARIFEYAREGFLSFVKNAGYHAPGKQQDDFIRLNGDIPDNVQLIKFERIADDLPVAARPYFRSGAEKPLEHVNRTSYSNSLTEELTDEIRELIYQKHRYMFDSGLYSMSTY